MPHKHSIKTYIENGFYHVYNRGVEKRDIFLDDQDYKVFLHLLKYYLLPIKEPNKHPLLEVTNHPLIRPRPLSNLADEINLLCFCLLPNHFHLLLSQKTKDGMTKLMRSLATTYAMYFNKRYDRVGYLFQGRYKGALIETDSYLLHLSRYIHLNPNEFRTNPRSYEYSSYLYFLGQKNAEWIKPQFILKFFDKSKLLPYLKKYSSYKDFVEKSLSDPREILGNLTID